MKDNNALILQSSTDFPNIARSAISSLQINLGYLCNMSCNHCHVNAGPTRTEMMDCETIDLALQVISKRNISTLDLTGGAPELNPHFQYFVTQARALGVHVIDRCNLTVLFEEGQEALAEFLAANKVEIIASLPCYEEENVDAQRGKGAYEKSIDAIRRLNELGYGVGNPSLPLNLVYNPTGGYLPPAQDELEADYKRALGEQFQISFDQLLTITNMPISRFGAVLVAKNEYASYMQLLRDNHSDANLENVMCKTLVSIDYLGNLFDCDFNQMLGLSFAAKPNGHLQDLLREDFRDNPIATADHCYGCTAGQGSSCSGALV